MVLTGAPVYCGAGAGIYLRLLERSLSEIPDLRVSGLGKFGASKARLFCSVPLSPQGKGQDPPPRDSMLAPDGHNPLTVPGATKHVCFLTSCCGCTLKVLLASYVRIFTSVLVLC